MNLVAECTTMSTPWLSGWHRYGVASVLSMTSGMLLSWATFEMPSKSKTSPLGLPNVSPKKAFVLGRMAAAQQMGKSQPTDAEAKLASIRCPALVIMGTLDSDWADPRAEADAIVAAMPAGLGRAVMIDGAGHYPHTQFPDQVAAALLPFLKEHAGA